MMGARNDESCKPAREAVTSKPKDATTASCKKAAQLTGEPGRPFRLTEIEDCEEGTPVSPLGSVVGRFLRTYVDAVNDLLNTKFAHLRGRSPAQWRVPCNIYIWPCVDGILIRYDRAPEEEKPGIFLVAGTFELEEAAPLYSGGSVHFTSDAANYKSKHPLPIFSLQIREADGHVRHQTDFNLIFICQPLPSDFVVNGPPNPPPKLLHATSDLRLRVFGETVPASDASTRTIRQPTQQFISDGVMPIRLGWEAIEVYPLLPDSYWDPHYASLWAEMELRQHFASLDAQENELLKLDGRVTERENTLQMLAEFESLLNGPEEPVHQFLKLHPELLSPLHEQAWSKLPFGKNVSDFVFREPGNDYVLVEIEAPIKSLFRKDGHPRAELQHPISQIRDWSTFIAENRAKVEQELGLIGISSMPRMLVVIGRSASLSEGERKSLRKMEELTPRLRIRTYDDILIEARIQFERVLGPLGAQGLHSRMYWFRKPVD